jgi:hypothetical protein
VKRGPELLLLVPLQGQVRAILVSDSFEDEQALAVDLSSRRLLDELIAALLALADALEEEAAA